MKQIVRGGMVRILLALTLWSGAQTVHAQSTAEAAAAAADDTALDAEIQARHAGFDRLARSFSKKKRSELINLKTYTDAEWAQLERDVRANNAKCRNGRGTAKAEACLAAGRAYETGDGVWLVPAIAFILYNEACEAGLGEGCRAFVDLANSGFGYPEGGMAATEGMIEKACQRGDLVACDRFADELRASGSAEDAARADALLDKTCAAGGEEACYSRGRALIESGAPGDASRGAAILDAACQRAVAGACSAMARQFEAAAAPDEVAANRYRHFACYAGSADDCEAMGERAWRGIGQAEDRALSVRYYQEACDLREYGCELPGLLTALPAAQQACANGDDRACAGAGLAFAEAGSPERDLAKAAPLLERGCLAGVGKVCETAASVLVLTKQAQWDAPQIAALQERGCAANDPEACHSLARILELSPDPAPQARAAALYTRLCDERFKQSCLDEARLAERGVATALRSADATFTPPLPGESPGALLAPSEQMETCFSGSERFRGRTYVEFNCDRSEKGINSERARPGQAPWQAMISRPPSMFGQELSATERVLCGGSLIAQGWVLTAAHCTLDGSADLAADNARAGYRIRLGVYYSDRDEGISYPILRIIRHPQFDPVNRYAFDIALIQYDARAPLLGSEGPAANPIRAIRLDPRDAETHSFAKGLPVYAFGWGWTDVSKSSGTDFLQIMAMKLKSERSCTTGADSTGAFRNAALCAIGDKREQACEGDSGGPLIAYEAGTGPVLIGVVSAGSKCGTEGNASKYTRVAKVRDWIASYVPELK